MIRSKLAALFLLAASSATFSDTGNSGQVRQGEAERIRQTLVERLGDNPLTMALANYEPDIVYKLFQHAELAALAGKPLEETVKAQSIWLYSLVASRVASSEDAVAIAYWQGNVNILRELMRVEGDACYRRMQPEPGSDPMTGVDAASIRAQQALLAKAIESAATAPQPIPTLNDIQSDFAQIHQKMTVKHGKDYLKFMVQPQESQAFRRQVCEIGHDFYAEMLNLPTARAGKIVRYMLSQR